MPSKRKPVLLLPHRRVSGLFLKDGEYIADIKPDGGRRIRRRLGPDRERALALFHALLNEPSVTENPRLADFLLETFLPSQRHLKDRAYPERCIRALVTFLEAEAPDLRLREVNRLHVERMRRYYAHLSPRTLNMYLQKWKQALYYAVELGLLDANPIAGVKALPQDNRRVRFLTVDDFLRILDAARAADAHDLFLFMGLTGLRPSNVRLLTADEVDGNVLRIPPEKMKNNRWGILPLSTFAQEVLAEREPTPYYFPARGRPDRPKSRTNLSRSYRRLVRRLDGLEWSCLYDLRHFFASELARNGATEMQIGRLLCHVGTSVTSRYIHHDIEDLRPLVEYLGGEIRRRLGREETRRRRGRLTG